VHGVVAAPERHFLFATATALSGDQVVAESNGRCNQENLIEQLKAWRPRSACSGQHAQRQLGLHSGRGPRVVAESLVRLAHFCLASVTR
jgi:hypothetical protein